MEKPKIVCFDLDEKVSSTLRDRGLNAMDASFGSIYKPVSNKGKYSSIMLNHEFPSHLRETDIVVIDNKTNFSDIGSGTLDINSDSERGCWAKINRGIVNPRCYSMGVAKGVFQEIFDNGGIFIVFCGPREYPEYRYGHTSIGVIPSDEILKRDNYGFLSELNDEYLAVKSNHGKEINENPDFKINERLFELIKNSNYECTLEPNWEFTDRFHPLALDKFKKPIAGFITPEEGTKEGIIILLPRVKNKKEIISHLITVILPSVAPRVFPDKKDNSWLGNELYEDIEVTKVRQEIENKKTEWLEFKKTQEEKITEIKTNNAFLADLITETGESLVKAVAITLTKLGFKEVIDVDEEIKLGGGDDSRKEDLQIRDYSPLLLVEVKGINGQPRDEDALAANKYVILRVKELDNTKISSLTIINNQRNTPCDKRDNISTFSETTLANAETYDIGLLTSWDLFRLYRSFSVNNWSHEKIKNHFYKSGRITHLPDFLLPIGEIQEKWGKINGFGFVLKNHDIKKGDKIAIELPNMIKEIPIDSMQVNKENVDEASVDDEVGIVTKECFALINKKQNIYLIKALEND